MKVNLGCGRDVKAGYVNVDRFPGPGVDVISPMESLPFYEGSVEHVYASHVLEHVIDFSAVWREIHRIMIVGGTLRIRVPYGFNTDPFHIRYFDEESIASLTGAGGPVGWNGGGTSSLERDLWWQVLSVSYLYAYEGFPRWHAQKYLGWRLPFARKIEMDFMLRKVR